MAGLIDRLETKWSSKTVGDTDFVFLEDAGDTRKPTGVEIVILDQGGEQVAYRYTDYDVKSDWETGTPKDVAEYVAGLLEICILDALTDGDVESWNEGVTTPNVESLFQLYGEFDIWNEDDVLHVAF